MKNVNDASKSRTAKRRSQIYGLLAAVYVRPVDESFLRALLAIKIPTHTQLPEISGQLVRSLSSLNSWLERESKDLESVSVRLAPEFTRLFRGLSRKNSPPPPYESVYLESRLFGETTSGVIEKYAQYGISPENNEPHDHISLELDFMRFLCDGESEAWKSGDDACVLLGEQGAFLDEHLLRWVPAFSAQIRKFDATGFYTAAVEVTEAWVNYDRGVITRLNDASTAS